MANAYADPNSMYSNILQTGSTSYVSGPPSYPAGPAPTTQYPAPPPQAGLSPGAPNQNYIYSQDAIDRQLAQIYAQNLDQALGQASRVQDSSAARGFGSNSPYAMGQASTLEAMGRAMGMQGQNQWLLGAQEANANYGLEAQKMANDYYLGQGQLNVQQQDIANQYKIAQMNAELERQLAYAQNSANVALQSQANLASQQAANPDWLAKQYAGQKNPNTGFTSTFGTRSGQSNLVGYNPSAGQYYFI